MHRCSCFVCKRRTTNVSDDDDDDDECNGRESNSLHLDHKSDALNHYTTEPPGEVNKAYRQKNAVYLKVLGLRK